MYNIYWINSLVIVMKSYNLLWEPIIGEFDIVTKFREFFLLKNEVLNSEQWVAITQEER